MRLGDPDGARPHATQRRTAQHWRGDCASGRDGRGEAGEAARSPRNSRASAPEGRVVYVRLVRGSADLLHAHRGMTASRQPSQGNSTGPRREQDLEPPNGGNAAFFCAAADGARYYPSVRGRKLGVEVKEAPKPKADSKPAGPARRPHPRSSFDRGRDPQSAVEKERSPAGDGSHEDAKHTVHAPVAGTVKQLLVQPGQQVEAKDLLLVIE